MSLTFAEKAAVRNDEKIEKCGLCFYPIKMTEYEIFSACRDAWIIRMGTLPAKYLSMDYLSALFMLEIDSVKKSGENVGLFDRAMRLLHLSLRIGYDAKEFIGRNIELKRDGDEIKISRLFLTQDGKKKEITPLQFSSKIRPLIAAQNGLELPNEKENIDLVRAAEERQKLAEKDAPKLKTSIDDLVASVAYQSGLREKDVMDFTVREFEARKRAIDRDKRFMLYGGAEMSGMVTFKNGNPAPSWCYDAVDDTLGTMTLSELQDRIKGVNENK